MRHCILILALFCLFHGNAQTHGHSIGCFEGEIGAGLVFGTDKLNFDKINPGATFYVEARYNFKEIPLDLGLQIGGTIFHRESDKTGQLKFKSWTYMALTNYNFYRMRKVSFFAGVGFGYASLENTAPIVFDNSQPNWGGFNTGDKKGSFCFMPRIGVELFHHLRITAAYKLAEKANSHFDLTVGVVFGCGSKKDRN